MKALVLSGGGSKGAWQLGVLRKLLVDEQVPYDIVAGISVGALNGSFICQYVPGEERAAWYALNELWGKVKPSRIRKRWFPFGKLHGFWKTGLYDSKPLWKLISSNLDAAKVAASGREFRSGSVELTSGEYLITDQGSDNLHARVAASSAYPVFFKAVEVDGKLHTDGGVRHITPLGAAIRAGATSIDCVVVETPKPQPWGEEKPNALELGVRSLELMNDQLIRADLKLAHQINLMVAANCADPKYRAVPIRLYEPSRGLGDGLDFSQKLVRERVELGYEDAETFRVL